MDGIAGLNHTFGIPAALLFEEGEGGLICARLAANGNTASVSLQGGHVIGWRLKGQAEPILWMSRDAKFAPGKSIRGGIPVCWPWFGAYDAPTLPVVAAPQGGAAPLGAPLPDADSRNPALPAHGFARTAEWTVADSGSDEAGGVWLLLSLEVTPTQRAMWPHAASLSLRVTLGDTLSLELNTENQGQDPFELGEALHTYFNISDISNISVGGLHGVTYWDTVGQVGKKQQNGPIAFKQETDRVYIDSPQSCVIEDLVFSRRIHIRKQGSLSTVVWNPWTDKAERMGDLGKPDGWRGFVCVESANAWDNKLTLAPGETHTLSVEYAVETL